VEYEGSRYLILKHRIISQSLQMSSERKHQVGLYNLFFLNFCWKVNYSAPIHDTPLLLRAKATLMMPFKETKRSCPSDFEVSPDGCCDKGNRYRISLYNTECVACPIGTTSMLRGLYCQPNNATAAVPNAFNNTSNT